MDLLDLPPEIFQKIIESYVHTIGVSEAWKRRDVCKTFAAFISEECLGRQPMTSYADLTAERLVGRHLGLFLEYRCKVRHGAPAVLPTIIRNVVDEFMNATEQSSDTARAVYTESTCNAIKDCFPYAIGLATTSYYRIPNEPVEAYCLVMAVWMKDKELITHYLSRVTSIWEPTGDAFSPIAVAAKSQATDIASQLLEHAKSCLTKTAKGKSNKELERITTEAVKSQHWDTAIMLIDWWFLHGRKPRPTVIVWWTHEAGRANATDFLHRVLDQELSKATKNLLLERLYDIENCWGNDNQDLLVEALIDRQMLDITGWYYNKRTYSGTLLALAAEIGNINIAKKYLESGMSPDGERNRIGQFEYPLVSAVLGGNKALVKLLLAHDADPEPAQDRIIRGDWERKSKVSKRMATLIRKAVDSKIAKALTHC